VNVEPPPDDAATIERTLAGDAEAFGELVSRYHRVVFALAYRMTGTRTEAEDLCQDVFLRVYRSLERFDRRWPFGPWLRKIACNAVLNHLRHRGVERGLIGGTRDDRDDTASAAAPDPGASPEENAARSQTADRLGRALATLPANQRLAFTLKYVEGLTGNEIAEAMDAPKNTVKTWLLRAREALRKELANDL
jgi:RNA polymerase sigma-70 factor (ECF subfamily)